MIKMRMKFTLAFALSFLAVSVPVFAQPTGSGSFTNITLLAAFLGGILMLLAPCSFSLIPAYFAYSVKSKSSILLSTFIFFLGFAFMFSLFGLSAGYIGYYLNLYKFSITFYSGIALIVVGLLILLGKNMPYFGFQCTRRKGLTGNFLFGVAYSFGYAGCAGPILLGVLLLAATQAPLVAVLTMFSYALGLGIPLMILSYFFDRLRLFNSKLLQKSVIRVGKRFLLSVSSLVSGLLFITIGYVFAAYQSASVLNYANQWLTDFSYSLQNLLLRNSLPLGDMLFFVVLVFLVLFIVKENGYLMKGVSRAKKKKRQR